MVQKDSGGKKVKNSFQKLDVTEMVVRCEQLSEEKGQLFFWEKGKPETLPSNLGQIKLFSKESLAFYLTVENAEKIIFDVTFCFNFTLKSRFYFGTGKFLNGRSGTEYSLNIGETLFRCERRKGHRFLK